MASEETLARLVQEGDPDALHELVEKHHRPLIGYLYNMLGGDQMLAEDLVQETFLRMMRSISTYHYPRPFKTWLYAIATNLAHDHFKRADTRHTIAMPEEFNHHDDTDYPESTMINKHEQEQVSTQIMQLPIHQREAMILRYYQEMPLAEIAQVLDIPIGTVKSRLSLGLRNLRKLMEQEIL